MYQSVSPARRMHGGSPKRGHFLPFSECAALSPGGRVPAGSGYRRGSLTGPGPPRGRDRSRRAVSRSARRLSAAVWKCFLASRPRAARPARTNRGSRHRRSRHLSTRGHRFHRGLDPDAERPGGALGRAFAWRPGPARSCRARRRVGAANPPLPGRNWTYQRRPTVLLPGAIRQARAAGGSARSAWRQPIWTTYVHQRSPGRWHRSAAPSPGRPRSGHDGGWPAAHPRHHAPLAPGGIWPREASDAGAKLRGDRQRCDHGVDARRSGLRPGTPADERVPVDRSGRQPVRGSDPGRDAKAGQAAAQITAAGRRIPRTRRL